MPELNNAWVMHDGKRKAFWATAHDLGLSEEETREALGLGPDKDGEYASTKTYSGTFDDALDAISGYANRQREADIDTEGLPEAPVVIYSQALSKTGFQMNFTVRGKTWTQATDLFAVACADIVSAGGTPLMNERYSKVRQPTPARESSSPPPSVSPPRESVPQGESAAEYNSVGWGNLKSITVNADGQVQFDVSNRRYPLKDSRGARVVAGLFRDDCWTQEFAPAHLSQPGVYQPQGLKVKSGKNDRGYWDCIEVRRA